MNEQQIFRFPHHMLIEELTKRNLSISGNTNILRTRLIRSCQQPVKQPLEFLAVIDFEATCVAKPPQPYIQEIIEFPIILIDVAQQKIVDTFHSYCRPVLQPILSDYCKQLTGITQEQINNAPVFVDVFANVEKWLNDRDLFSNSQQKCLFVSDSPSDFNKYLHMQSEIAHIVYPKWAYQWNNIKTTFTSFYSMKSGRIRDMLDKLGLSFHGQLHSGLDDATNIGRIIIELIKDGCVLLPNEFYAPSMIASAQNPQLPFTQWPSARMICLNCSRPHSENQRSCIQGVMKRRKRAAGSDHSQFHSDQLLPPTKIPSLLDFCFPRTSNRVSEHHSRMSWSPAAEKQ